MKKIICELCEGTQFVKENGMFVCQECGTKYSAEEARGMIIEIEAEGNAKSVAESVPTVSLNQQLNNILALATTAYESGKYKEAEEYCNTAIGMDATQYKVWFLKGRAIGWQSKIQNVRIKEAGYAFSRAIDNAPANIKERVKNASTQELKKLGIALISLRKKRFIVRPSKAELKGFVDDRIVLIETLMFLLSQGNTVSIPEGYLDEIATIMYLAGIEAFDSARKQWEAVLYHREEELLLYIEKLNNIERLIRQAIDASKDDAEQDVQRYKMLISIIKEPIGKWSYKEVVDENSNKIEVKDKCLRNADKEKRENDIKVCEIIIDDLTKKLSIQANTKNKTQKSINESRNDHNDEYKKLELEKKTIMEEKDKLSAELEVVDADIKGLEDKGMEDVPSEKEKSEVQDQIRELKNRRANLGIFGGKERKYIEEQLIDLEYRRTMLQNQVNEEMEAKATSLKRKMTPLKDKRTELIQKLETLSLRIGEINRILEKGPDNNIQ